MKPQKEMFNLLNLVSIFQKQAELNQKTAAKHEEYQKRTRDELTRNYVFATLVELGEMANEWGHFKIWKSTRKENREALCPKCHGRGEFNGDACPYCEGGMVNPLREEYIDVVHFTISIALGFDLDPQQYIQHATLRKVSAQDSYKLYLELYKNLVYANVLIDELENFPPTEKLLKNNQLERKKVAVCLVNTLWELGYSLGFTDEEIEYAYFAKHKINQVRQENNY